MSDVVEIREAASAPEFAVVRDLIEQYAQALGVDLKFQNSRTRSDIFLKRTAHHEAAFFSRTNRARLSAAWRFAVSM